MKTRKVKVKAQPVYDLNTRAAADEFIKAAEKFTRENMNTRENVLRELIAMGIYTKSGRISKNYSR